MISPCVFNLYEKNFDEVNFWVNKQEVESRFTRDGSFIFPNNLYSGVSSMILSEISYLGTRKSLKEFYRLIR